MRLAATVRLRIVKASALALGILVCAPSAGRESTWLTATDCDRLDAAFAAMEREGIVARQRGEPSSGRRDRSPGRPDPERLRIAHFVERRRREAHRDRRATLAAAPLHDRAGSAAPTRRSARA